MKDRLSNEEWLAEFQEFLAAPEARPPQAISDRILAIVHKDLNPPAWLVFSKVAMIHVFVGTLSLLACPQFGVGPLQGYGLMNFLMQFGHSVCMLACGAFFVSGTALVASLVLRPEEVRVVRKTELLQFAILSLLSVGVFLCLGTSVVVSLFSIWFAGSVLGGLATLELGWLVRSRLSRR